MSETEVTVDHVEDDEAVEVGEDVSSPDPSVGEDQEEESGAK